MSLPPYTDRFFRSLAACVGRLFQFKASYARAVGLERFDRNLFNIVGWSVISSSVYRTPLDASSCGRYAIWQLAATFRRLGRVKRFPTA
jgi:hypothetical protein